MIWPQAHRVVITDMNMGQYRDVHTIITYAEVFGKEWIETAEKITFKFEFEDGYLKTYFKDTMDENAEYILAAESTYSAKGDQIAIRGKIITDSSKNYVAGQTFLDMKINGVDAFEESVPETPDTDVKDDEIKDDADAQKPADDKKDSGKATTIDTIPVLIAVIVAEAVAIVAEAVVIVALSIVVIAKKKKA
jgi:hypothetical protein